MLALNEANVANKLAQHNNANEMIAFLFPCFLSIIKIQIVTISNIKLVETVVCKNKIDVLTDKLFSKFQNTIKINESKVNLLISSLKDKNPLNLLEKGYVKVEKNNKVINTINMIKLKDELNIIFKDGNVKVEVKDINGRI